MSRSLCCRMLVLIALSLFALPVNAEDEKPQEPDCFLRDWAWGRASFDIDTRYHADYDYPGSPHKRASEEYEVAVKAFFIRRKCGGERTRAFAGELAKLYALDRTPKGVRRRILHVLGRLQVPDSVGLLVSVAGVEDRDLRESAIRSLAFFGSGPAEESFGIFGGRIRFVVFPPAPSETATSALLAKLRELREAKPPSEAPPGKDFRRRREERLQWWGLHFVLLRALESHRGPKVAGTVLDTLTGACAWPDSFRWNLQRILVRNLPDLEPKRLIELLDADQPVVRRIAIHVLGWSASPDAVAPLLKALDDDVLSVSEEANDALLRITGTSPAVFRRERTIQHRSLKDWRELLGESSGGFEPEKAIRFQDREPGIYRVGR